MGGTVVVGRVPPVHPIELLRHVARSGGRAANQLAMAEQAVYGLAALADEDPAAMVTACRLLIEKHPEPGSLRDSCERMLAAADPQAEADALLAELNGSGSEDW